MTAGATMRTALAARATELLLAAAVALGGVYFFGGTHWNQISRYDAVFSFVEPGTPDTRSFRINGFLPDPERGVNTGDWAQNRAVAPAAYYSNKAPGPILLAVPVYAALYWLERAAGVTPTTETATVANAYLVNVAVTVLPLALSSVCFFWLAVRLGGDRRWALLVTLGLYLGTLLLPYGTQFWGHATAAAFAAMALYGLAAGTARTELLAGLCLGLGALCEYSLGVLVAGAVAGLLLQRRFGSLARLVAGGLLPLLAFLAYHRACFGTALTIANVHNNPGYLDPQAAGGLFHAKALWAALWGLTFEPYRGLFIACPLVLLALLAGVGRLRWRPEHWVPWLALATLLAFFGLNLVFTGWHGGACIGARYQIPALPCYFVLAALVPAAGLAAAARRRAAWAWGAVLALSFANMVMVTAESPVAREFYAGVPAEWRNPVGLYYRMLLGHGVLHPRPLTAGKIRPAVYAGTEPAAARYAFNLGELAGLDGRASLLPWALALGALIAALFRLNRAPPALSQTPAPPSGGP